MRKSGGMGDIAYSYRDVLLTAMVIKTAGNLL